MEAGNPILIVPNGWEVKQYADALQGKPQPPWIIDTLLLDKCGNLVSAHPHSMKSLSWLYACMEAPITGKVFGHFAAPNITKTLFIETEDPDWMVESRIRGFAKGLELKNDSDIPGFYYVCPGPFDLTSMEDALDRLLDSFRPNVAVISTLQNLLQSRDMNKPSDMQPVHAVILSLARKYCPIVLITHSPWDSNLKRAMGTVTQTANYAVTSHYTKEGNTVRVLLDSKVRGEETFRLVLETEGKEVRRVVYCADDRPRGTGRDRVLQEIALDPKASPKLIAERAGVTDRYVREIMAEQLSSARPAQPPELTSEQRQNPMLCH